MKFFEVKKAKEGGKEKQKGFALLFSILVAVLMVSLGASIVSIALRQVILSGTSRESQYAFYAANTGIECALYWDLNSPASGKVVFPASGEDAVDFSGVNNKNKADFTCAGVNLVDGPQTGYLEFKGGLTYDYKNYTADFNLVIENDISGTPIELCTKVNVKKKREGGKITTTISSRGYNTCDLSNPRAVERGLQMKYQY